MKNSKPTRPTPRIFLTLTALFVTFLLGSCNKDPLKDISIVLDPQLMEYTVMVEIYDAADREPLSVAANNLSVTFEGPLASEILNNNGTRVYEIIDGRMSIGLHPRVDIAPGEIKSVMMRITADGYQDKTSYLYFQSSLKNQLVPISMINIEAPPSGVGTTDSTITLGGGGTTTAPVVISTSNSSSGSATEQSVEIAIPANTQFKDENNNPVVGTDLKVEVVSFDARDSIAIQNFPGGFSPNGVLNVPGGGGNRSESDVFFVTGGFTSVDMTVGTTPIRSFNQPIDVTVDVDSLTVNPNTGNPVQVGDSLPIWSYDNSTAKWSYERVGVITRDSSSGKMTVQFPTTHLSWFNLDWYGSRCSSPTRLQFSIPAFAAGTKENFWVEIVHAGTNQLVTQWAAANKYVGNNEIIDFLGVPNLNTNNQVVQMQAKVYRNISKTELLATSTTFSCGQTGQVTLNLQPPFVCNLDVTGICASKSYVQFRPSFPLYYKAATSTGPYEYLGYVSMGAFSTTSLTQGNTYKFRTYFNGQTIDSTMTVNQSNFIYTIEMGSYCDNF
jgi:hypothetical protein